MGTFNREKIKKIRVLNIENRSSVAFVTYEAEYSDKTTKTFRVNVKDIKMSSAYSGEPHIVNAECVGTVYIGIIKSDSRMLFIVTLSNFSVDIVQARDGSSECSRILAKCGKTEDETITFEGSDVGYTDSVVENISIPIEVLPNLYSIRLSNIALEHHLSYKNGKKIFDYVTLKCKVNYYLNGRKEGKRHIIFTSYDSCDRIVDIKGEYDKYTFTEAGYEFVDVCFSDYGNKPICKIRISVRET